jgi:hypothetical protein
VSDHIPAEDQIGVRERVVTRIEAKEGAHGSVAPNVLRDQLGHDIDTDVFDVM